MIRSGNDNAIPYRAPVIGIATPGEFTKDEANYNTLENVLKNLDARIEGLYKDFNAFNILDYVSSPNLNDAVQKMMVTIMAKQEAYDILVEARDTIKTATDRANENYKERNHQ